MYLRSIKYSEFEDTVQKWLLDGLLLGSKNLIVGKNASGKSRTLNIINSLSEHLAGLKPAIASGKFNVEFINEQGIILKYLLHLKDDKVVKEKFSIKDRVLLDRNEDGTGTIWAEEIEGGMNIRFQTPSSELAAVARRDTIQHKFLEPLYAWGSSLRHYHFGTSLGQDKFAIFNKKAGKKLNERDTNNVVPIYRKAFKEFKEEYKQLVMTDMARLDYEINDIGVISPISIRVISSLPGELVGLYVKEKDLPGNTDQISMSQGMFRALSILIQINYSQMAKKATCILIDDIGEGLDFDRSCKLINLLREKAEKSNIQFILSTNDRFVMNNVPLEEWSIIHRQGGHVNILNNENSHKIFEDFKYTGLSNFSFLELDYMNEKKTEENTADE